MLVKSLLEPLLMEVPHDAPNRGCSTPHCIKLPSAEEDYRQNAGCKQRRIDLSCMTAGAALSAAVVAATTVHQPAVEKFVKVLESKTAGKKTLTRPLVQQKHITDNHKLTDYFPVRRSVRKCKKVVLEEKQRDLENKVLSGVEDGLQVRLAKFLLYVNTGLK